MSGNIIQQDMASQNRSSCISSVTQRSSTTEVISLTKKKVSLINRLTNLTGCEYQNQGFKTMKSGIL